MKRGYDQSSARNDRIIKKKSSLFSNQRHNEGARMAVQKKYSECRDTQRDEKIDNPNER
jgi:hypothetical protein